MRIRYFLTAAAVLAAPMAALAAPLDHFKCYRTHGRSQDLMVSLLDQFDTVDARVLKPARLCNPVNKNDEGIFDETAHLACYRTRDLQASFAPRTVTVQNQLGTQSLKIYSPIELCVPSVKNDVPSALQVNHFRCYKAVARPRIPYQGADVTLTDQFESRSARVRRPLRFCVPVDKDGEGILDAAAQLTCYRMTDTSDQPPSGSPTVSVDNQFGDDQSLTARAPAVLCVPSTPSTTTSTTTTTTSTTTTTESTTTTTESTTTTTTTTTTTESTTTITGSTTTTSTTESTTTITGSTTTTSTTESTTTITGSTTTTSTTESTTTVTASTTTTTTVTTTTTTTNATPVPGNDTYNTAVGNTLVEVGVTPSGFPAVQFTGSVLDNDSDPDNQPSPLSVTGTSSVPAGAQVVMNSNGTFTYRPTAGVTGSQAFNYTVSDGLSSAQGTVTINLSNVVWYVDNAAGGGGDGRSHLPFNSLASVNGAGGVGDPDLAGHIIFVHTGSGSYAGGIGLENTQQLIGRGVALVVNGHTLVTAGTRPVIGNAGGAGVTLASGNTVRGLNVNANAGITGTSVGTATINNAAVTATAGAAVNINTGALTVSLDSASATGSTNGIVLANTTGSFTVTGDGSTAGSGGSIHDTTGDGISLTNATNVSLSFMSLTGNDGNGIFGDDLTGFSLISSSVTGSGDTTDGSEAGLRFKNLLGTCAITNSTIASSSSNNIRMTPRSGALTLNVSGSTIQNSPASGFLIDTDTTVLTNTANVTVNMTGTAIKDNFASGLITSFHSTSAQTINVSSSTFQNNNVGVDLGTSENADMTFNVTNNTAFTNQATTAIAILTADTATTNCQVNGTISGNPIGLAATAQSGSINGNGIRLDLRGSADAAIAVSGNTIHHTDKEGILALARLNTPTLDLHVAGNTVTTPDDDELPGFPVNPPGIQIQAQNASTMCLDIKNNTSAGAGTGAGYRARQQNTSVFQLERFTGNGMLTSDVASFLQTQNTSGTGSATLVAGFGFTGVADGACQDP